MCANGEAFWPSALLLPQLRLYLSNPQFIVSSSSSMPLTVALHCGEMPSCGAVAMCLSKLADVSGPEISLRVS